VAGWFIRLVTATVVATTASVLAGYDAPADDQGSVTHSSLDDAPINVVTDYLPDSGGGI